MFPPPPSLFSRLVGSAPKSKAGKTALIDGITGETIGYDSLQSLCEDFAAVLQGKYGLKEQGVLAVFSPNDAYYSIALWGALRIGGIATTANHVYTAEELVHQLQDSKAQVLLTHHSVLPTALEAARSVGIPTEKILLFSRNEQDPSQRGFPTIKELIKEWGSKRKRGELVLRNFRLGKEAKERIAFLCYSSGTTGRSKGVMISHRNVIANVCQMNSFEAKRLAAATQEEILLAVLPFYHIYGLILLVHIAAFRGSITVVIPKFDPPVFLSCIQKYKVSLLYLVPPIILFLAQHPVVDQFDTSSVNIVFSGAAPLPWETVNQLKRRKGFKNVIVQQGWGMTETSTAVTATPVNDVRVGSIGEILPSLEIKLVDPDTQEEVGVDKEGEIWVRGPNITLGYLNNKKATEDTYKNGWLLTGDIGVVDKDGLLKNAVVPGSHFYIRDRIKELIKVKGLQVAPAELEALLMEHPAVGDACVVQVPDERSGELPRAYVVLKPSHENQDHEEIKESINKFFASRLARHKQLAGGIVFVDSVPKSPSGKLLRRFLRDRAKKEWALEVAKPRL
ncbi:hypothetical protein HDU93_009397 [Gonapodya sp. JEL0774]|nr:hypothetical protein HDU93_009397 [Gonapodya sp. JEL0774]